MSATTPYPVHFAVLGEVRAWRNGRELDLGSPQQRAVLAVLLLGRGRPVTVGGLVDTVWGESVPAAALPVLRTYVARLRKVLEPRRGPGAPPQLIVSVADGYLIRVADSALDLAVFERRVAEAKRLRAAGEDAAAAELLRAALELWDGTPLAGLTSASAAAERSRLDEQRLDALETRVEADLRLGRHDDVIIELDALSGAHPLRERPHRLRMLALYRAGRQAEALAAYRRARQNMVEELGVEPSPPLQQLHTRILSGDPSLDAPAAQQDTAVPKPQPGGQPSPPPAFRPGQLPADLPVFTGRKAELCEVRSLLGGARPPDPVNIVAIDGMPGAGKTTLAVHVAHEIADRFPDGQLYVNLRGSDADAAPTSRDETVRHFLDALGVPPHEIPAEPEARAVLYRSLLTGRRVLLLLDNARDSDQVRALLPTGPGCLAVVTGRNRLVGLIAGEGAYPLTVGPLPAAEAHDLLVRRLGAGRLDAEPRAVDEILEHCRGLPLALAVVAARAAVDPDFPLSAVADELRRNRGSLDAFTGDDPSTDLRAVFSSSYRALSPPAARLFRLVGLHPGTDLTVAAAAAVSGLSARAAHTQLAELADAHLLAEHLPGRYVAHHLLGVYAAERAEAEEDAADRERARQRLLSWYLHTADAAARFLVPERPRPVLDPLPPGVQPLAFAAHAQALDWCEREIANLAAVEDHAAAHGRPDVSGQLTGLSLWGRFHPDSVGGGPAPAVRSGPPAGRGTPAGPSTPNPAGRAADLVSTADLLAAGGRLDEAVDHYLRALPFYQAAKNLRDLSHILFNVSGVCLRAGRTSAAISYARRALTAHRTARDPLGEGVALSYLGSVYLRGGQLADAEHHLRQALANHAENGARRLEGVTLERLGAVHHRLGRDHEAIDLYRRALTAHRSVGNRWQEAHTLGLLAGTQLAVGDAEAARASWAQAVAILGEPGLPDAAEIRARLLGPHDVRHAAADGPDRPDRPDAAGHQAAPAPTAGSSPAAHRPRRARCSAGPGGSEAAASHS